MANVYVDSAAAGAGTGASWSDAYTTLGAAAAAKAAGDKFFVASSHAESAASAKTITFPGTSASPNECWSVNKAGSVPPVAADILAGASITTTGANDISLSGYVYIYGVTLNCGTGSSAATIFACNSTGGNIIYDTCALKLLTTSGSSRINVAQNAVARTDFINTTVEFSSTSQGFSAVSAGQWVWRNKPGSTAVTGATLPTTLVVTTSPTPGVMAQWYGLDLSAFGSGKTLVAANTGRLEIVNCKLGASVTIAGTPGNSYGRGIYVIGSHSSGNVRRDEIYNYAGTLTTETTILRTAGASDGTTAYSWKVVTTANAKRTFPFETFEGAVWNTTLSSRTLTIHTVTDNVTLTDAEIWLEVEYLGSSGTPVTTLITDANATVLTTAANQTSDSGEAWTTTGLTTPVKQALAVTFTPAMVGPIRWKVKVAKASTTVYVCPKADLS